MEDLKKKCLVLSSEREAILLTALQTTKPCSCLPVGKRYDFSCRWHGMKQAIVYSNREGPETTVVRVSSGLYPGRFLGIVFFICTSINLPFMVGCVKLQVGHSFQHPCMPQHDPNSGKHRGKPSILLLASSSSSACSSSSSMVYTHHRLLSTHFLQLMFFLALPSFNVQPYHRF